MYDEPDLEIRPGRSPPRPRYTRWGVLSLLSIPVPLLSMALAVAAFIGAERALGRDLDVEGENAAWKAKYCAYVSLTLGPVVLLAEACLIADLLRL